MNADELLKNILNDVRVELADAFDRNFEEKGFFGTPWVTTKLNIKRGSLMLRTGSLRQSISSTVEGSSIRFSSSLPYASLHNEGGEITVTPKMKKYFWAMYYQAAKGITRKKDGTASASKSNVALTAEAEFWKGMALKKVGEKMRVPERRFLGHHPEIDRVVREIVDENMQELAKDLGNRLRPRR